LEGPSFINNKDEYNLSKDNSSFDLANSDSHSFNNPFVKVYYGPTDADNELLKFVDRANIKIDSCVSSLAPSVIVEVDNIKQRRMEAAKKRNVKFRYVTEITKENIDYIKQMLVFAEIRHIEGMKGNFEVSDEKEYVAVATLKKAQPLPQLIFSNIPEIVEQEQFVFDSFWERAVPAEQIINEIEEGVVHSITQIFSDYKEAEKKEHDMISNAAKEIQIIYSTSNAFYLQEKSGTLQLLKEMADKNKDLKINILLPMDSSIRQSLSFGLLNKNLKNTNIIFQDIAPSVNIKIKSLVVDRTESLIMELKHPREEKLTASIGFSIYSNSESIVLSYASIFEVLYNQSILFGQMKEEENVKNEFINIAAHELRTPIMPILNGLEILEEKLGDKKNKFRREIDIITRNASRLQNLAEGILQVSRIESGSFGLSIQKDVDIYDLILQVIDDVEKKYMYTDKAKKVAIVFEPLSKTCHQNENYVDNDITVTNEIEKEKDDENNNDEKKARHKPLYMDCDSQKISQVIFNLLDNAMKFTTEGQIVVSTAFQREILPHNDVSSDVNTAKENKINAVDNFSEKRNDMLVTIKDPGFGVNSTIKDQLFEKFSSRSTQGTGLGLYLSKKIVEAHGGKIWYEEPNDDDDEATPDSKNNDSNTNNNNSIEKQRIGSIFRFSLPVIY
jgi:two-component system, OmpR family, sensor histidine kinase VicK